MSQLRTTICSLQSVPDVPPALQQHTAHPSTLLSAAAAWLQAHRKAVLRTVVLSGILSGAVVLAKLLPVSKGLPCPYCTISSYIGWTYFLMWSVSFYPQLIINWRRKSVAGVSFDYLAFNVAGFACYSVFNLALKFSPVVQQVRSVRTAIAGSANWLDTLQL
jgi:uncharacterized protein with PQ loop repeat